jgi:phosphohistidine phosphatase SixA
MAPAYHTLNTFVNYFPLVMFDTVFTSGRLRAYQTFNTFLREFGTFYEDVKRYFGGYFDKERPSTWPQR